MKLKKIIKRNDTTNPYFRQMTNESTVRDFDDAKFASFLKNIPQPII